MAFRYPGIFDSYSDSELAAQRDMAEHGRRLSAFRAKTEGKVWQQQENGEWWLVTVHTSNPR